MLENNFSPIVNGYVCHTNHEKNDDDDDDDDDELNCLISLVFERKKKKRISFVFLPRLLSEVFAVNDGTVK